MNEIIEKEKRIENMIYEIRGKQVMLDSDLAKLYGCVNGTKTINLAVKRNIERFPEDFYFQLTKEEFTNLKFQFETSNSNGYGGIRKMPYVFTEQGVAMLSAVLRTKVASTISIEIMRAFVSMRKYISNNLIEQKYINELVLKDNKRIDILEQTFDKFKDIDNHIFFKGQIYDAYSLLIEILNKSSEEIIIIDNYAGKELLDIIKDVDKRIIIVSKNMTKELIKKYSSQYKNVEFIINNSFHDRFIIIDKKELYHCGASFKDLGKECLAINKVDNANYIPLILKEILEYK